MEGLAMSEQEAKDIFIQNIHDPDYMLLKETLSTGLNEKTLQSFVNELQKKEMQLNRDADYKKRVRRQLLTEEDFQPNAKKRHLGETTGENDGAANQTSLPSVVNPNLTGIIQIRPGSAWTSLQKTHKDFVIKYNRAIRHSEEPPAPPAGVTIGPKSDDENGNGDVKTTRQIRRIGNESDKEDQPLPSRPHVTFAENDEDIKEDDPPEPIATIAGKPISFHLTTVDPTMLNTPRRFKQASGIISNTRRTRRMQDEDGDLLIVDSGGGSRPTITKRAWIIIGGDLGLTAGLSPYQGKGQVSYHPVVHGVTKATIPGFEDPILLKLHYATLITQKDDPNERESLLTTMDMGYHGVKINGIHPNDEKFGLTVGDTFIPFEHNDEAIFFRISKPTEEELNIYEVYELNAPIPTRASRKRRLPEQDWATSFEQLPISELRKRFAYQPDDILKRTLQNTTQYYLEIEEENRSNPQRHFRKRFKAIPDNRQNEDVATDFVYFSVKTAQGHKGGQFFTGISSKKWAFFPLKKEAQNVFALMDYIREYGPPNAIVSDNAKSEVGSKWTEILRDRMIKTKTSEPHHPHQNPSETEWGRLGYMMKNVLRQSNAPIELAHWCAIYCCQINLVTSRRSLGYKTPFEISTGHTPDISKHRFYFYEPLWYHVPNNKVPKDNMKKARFLAVAESCGDAMTYFILTEPDSPKEKRQVLMRSVIRTRRKNIGQDDEYVNDNPSMESFTISLSEALALKGETDATEFEDLPLLVAGERIGTGTQGVENLQQEDEDVNEIQEEENQMNDPEENLPVEFNATNNAESYEPILETTHSDLDDDMEFKKILNHSWEADGLMMKVQYRDSSNKIAIDVPFKILKKDQPLACAKYIKNYILEERRGERPLNNWAREIIKSHSNIVRRMFAINPEWRSKFEDSKSELMREILRHRLRRHIQIMRIRRNGPSRNAVLSAMRNREKYGVKIPNTIREAYQLDAENNNNLWAESIKKEMDNLGRLHVFKYHPPTKDFPKEDGWQKAPMRMIFDLKSPAEGLRRKSRLVIGGHKVDSSEYNTYSSQVDNMSVTLLFLIAQHKGLNIMTSDISNAFVTAPNSEKVWSVAGEEFGNRQGQKVEIQRALYGLGGSARAFSDFLSDTLRRLGFNPSRADPDLWIKKTDYGYDYIATHVDDIIVASRNPEEYISLIEQEFSLRNTEVDPSYYLGSSLKRMPNKLLQMNMEEFIKEAIRKYEKKHNITLRKENTPMQTNAHPEQDQSEMLGTNDHKDFQHIIGICQWLVIRGRIDITYATSSLSRFSTSPREGHWTMAKRILGYLKKYPKKGLVINPATPKTSDDADTQQDSYEDFGHQYKDFVEELDPGFPEPSIPELDINIFSDSDHAHDLVTGRSITGIIAFVGSTPIYWKSTRQTSVQVSTFGSEFTALRQAVEVAIEIIFHLNCRILSINTRAINTRKLLRVLHAHNSQ